MDTQATCPTADPTQKGNNAHLAPLIEQAQDLLTRLESLQPIRRAPNESTLGKKRSRRPSRTRPPSPTSLALCKQLLAQAQDISQVLEAFTRSHYGSASKCHRLASKVQSATEDLQRELKNEATKSLQA